MKKSNLIIYCIVFLVLISSCYALCQNPDLIKQRQCLAKCETGLVMQASCSEACNKEMNDYIKCTEDEQKAKEFIAEKGFTAKVRGAGIKVTHKDGTVETVTSGMTIRYGDTIETPKSQGYATLTLEDGTLFKLSPGSKLKFDADIEKKCDNADWVARLVRRMRAGVVHRRERFEVRTPQACCCVRGTEFLVDYDDVKNTTKVYLYDGELDVISEKDETFALNSGEMITLDSNGNVDRASLSEEEWESVSSSIGPEEEILPTPVSPSQITPKEQKKSTKNYLLIAAAVAMIIFGAIIATRKNKQ